MGLKYFLEYLHKSKFRVSAHFWGEIILLAERRSQIDLLRHCIENLLLCLRPCALFQSIDLEQIFLNYRESTGYVIDLILGLAM